MSAHQSLSSEELNFIRQLFSNTLIGNSLQIPTFTVDGGPQANALFASLGEHAQLELEAKLGNYRMSFPVQLVEDELHSLQLELGAPSIFEEGAVRRAWRLILNQPLALLDQYGAATPLSVHELSPDSLLVAANDDDEPPEQFCLWLPLPDHEPMPVKGRRIRIAGSQLAAYRLLLNHREHVERLRQFIFEQYRLRHPQLQFSA
ncbi:MAG TPA: PilZ domain-containing protein [Pseudomonas sp.]|nr:PilZ domain-containing protein [Pseudomonas sp.]